jgi:serine/threonine-protein kinase
VKILDFGIAKIKRAGGTGGTLRTQTGLIMGSPAYMSPEQCKDSADVDLRSDIYSFAIIVYEMLAGRTPYVAASGTEMLLMHLTGTPPPLRELVADLPAHVETAIKRALARARADRFDSMASFVAALRGEVVGETADLGRLSPSEELPAVGGTRTRVAPSITTFSRATGETGAVAADELEWAAVRPRRWPFFAFGAVVVAGLALFLLVRPGHESAPPPLRGTLRIAAPDAGHATPVAIARPDAAPVAVLPSSADSGTTPPVAAGAQPSIKPAHAPAVAAPVGRRRAKLQAPRSTPPPPAAASSSSPSLPPALPKQDNPAGF